jgi:tetratricopeptide (TPR) repeat protein
MYMCESFVRSILIHPSSQALRSVALLVLIVLLASCHRSAGYYTARADKLYSAGKYADAALNYRKAIQASATSGEAHAGLGLVELKLAQLSEAYHDLTRATDLLPARDDLKVTLGDLITNGYFADKHRPKILHDQLGKLADQLMKKDPFDALRFKGYLAASDNDAAAAEQFFEKANAIQPLEPRLIFAWCQVLFLTNQFEKGERLALDLIRKDKSFSPIYDLLSNQYVKAQHPAEAAKLLETRVIENPKDANARLRLASLYAGAGSPEKMTATLQAMLHNPADFPHAHMQVGDFYVGLQDWDQALREFQAGAQAAPKEKSAYMKKITNMYLAQGKGDQASEALHEIIKTEPTNDEAIAVNAALLLQGGRPEKVDTALAEFQKLVQRNPENPIWHFNLGLAYLAKKKPDTARGQFEEAVKLNKNYVPPRLTLAEMSLERNAYPEALRYANEALARRPALLKAMLYRSEALMGSGNYSEARSQLEVLEQTSPKDREGQLQFALLELTEKRYKQAEERFRKVYDEHQRDPQALIGLIKTYTAERQLDVAYKFLTEESKKAPYSETAHLLLADVAGSLSKHEVALSEYQHLLERYPKSTDLYVRVASAFRAKGDTGHAIANLQAALRLDHGESAAAAPLADILEESGRKLEALSFYRQALAAHPGNLGTMNNLAFLIADVGGNLDEALNLSQQVVKKAPQQPDFADTLGWIYLKKGTADAALGIFRNLAHKYPDQATYRYHLGLALLRQGDKAKARAELQAALSKHPTEDVNQGIKIALLTAGVQQP